jgi:uncharacterized phiE125 gp8 family phage protein
MMLIDDTPVAEAALPVAAFKAHLRLGSGFAEDSVQDPVLVSFLRAALAAIEARSGRVLYLRDFGLSLHRWRDPGAQVLPVNPVTEITGVTLIGRDGSDEVVAPARYWLERDAQEARLRPVGSSLPRIPCAGSAQIAFRAGFGAAWEDLPADLRQAVMMLATHYYEYREDTGLSEGCMPFGVSSLIERYRVIRLRAGAVR